MKNSDDYNPKQQLQIPTISVMMKALNREKKRHYFLELTGPNISDNRILA